MSSRNIAGRASVLSVLDRPIVRVLLSFSIALAMAVLFITAAPTRALAADCTTDGIDCIIPDKVDFSLLNIVSNILLVGLNLLILVAIVVSLFYSVLSLIGIIRAVKSRNKDELRTQGLTLGVSIVVLILAGTGAWFTLIKDAVEQGGNQLS